MPARKKSSQNSSSSKPTDDENEWRPDLIAVIAASLMPPMELPATWETMHPSALHENIHDEVHDWTKYPGGPVEDHDGSTCLDVVMREAIFRARLLLRHAQGLLSQTQKHWQEEIVALKSKRETLLPAILKALARVKTPMKWEAFAEIALPTVSDAMRKVCWVQLIGFEATGIENSKIEHEHAQKTANGPGDDPTVEPHRYTTFVFESQATLEELQNPECLKLDDGLLQKEIQPADFKDYAIRLNNYYWDYEQRIRKQISRISGKSGGRKAQRAGEKAKKRWASPPVEVK